MPDLILAGDVGGTNTRLRLVDAGDTHSVLLEKTYADRPVADALAAFFGEIDGSVKAGCLGVAGRVVDGDVRMTNRPGESITNENVAAALKLSPEKVRLVNDMVAHGAGIDACDHVMLRDGTVEGDVEGIVMPGTGLGVGMRVKVAGGHVAIPSEGGHLDFGPPTMQLDFLRDAAQDLLGTTLDGRVSWENLCSGPGLPKIYAAVVNPDAPGDVQQPLPKQITAAVTGGDYGDADESACREAVRLFLTLTGARAGNLCLDVLATRGIVFGGGILNGLFDAAPDLVTETISDAFTACGPDALRPTMQAVPLRLMRDADSGLIGAAELARDLA